MTTTDDTAAAPLAVDLTLRELSPGAGATFGAYLRLEPIDAAAEGFGLEGAVYVGLEGAVYVRTTIDVESWEGLGSPVVIPCRLRRIGEPA